MLEEQRRLHEVSAAAHRRREAEIKAHEEADKAGAEELEAAARRARVREPDSQGRREGGEETGGGCRRLALGCRRRR